MLDHRDKGWRGSNLMGETQSLPWEPQSDGRDTVSALGNPQVQRGKQCLPRASIHWEENKRQVVLIGADIWCPRPEMGGGNVEAIMAPGLQLRGLGLRT